MKNTRENLQRSQHPRDKTKLEIKDKQGPREEKTPDRYTKLSHSRAKNTERVTCPHENPPEKEAITKNETHSAPDTNGPCPGPPVPEKTNENYSPGSNRPFSTDAVDPETSKNKTKDPESRPLPM